MILVNMEHYRFTFKDHAELAEFVRGLTPWYDGPLIAMERRGEDWISLEDEP